MTGRPSFFVFHIVLKTDGRRGLLLLLRKEPVLEKQEVECPAGHAAIRKVEHRIKEHAGSAPENLRQAVGEKREVEHVHHLTGNGAPGMMVSGQTSP